MALPSLLVIMPVPCCMCRERRPIAVPGHGAAGDATADKEFFAGRRKVVKGKKGRRRGTGGEARQGKRRKRIEMRGK